MMHDMFLLAFAALVSLYAGQKVISYFAARRFIKKNGCKLPHRLPQSERIIGYGLLKEVKESERKKTILEDSRQRTEANGETFQMTLMGNTFIKTIDPENVKSILATKFEDFGLGSRLDSFGPLLGSGIFTTDGAHWEHSRVSSDIERVRR